ALTSRSRSLTKALPVTVAGGGSVQASVTRIGLAVSATEYDRRTLWPVASSVVSWSTYSRCVASRAAPRLTRPQPSSVFGAEGIWPPLPLLPPARSTAELTSTAFVIAGDGGCAVTLRTHQSRSRAAAPAT